MESRLPLNLLLFCRTLRRAGLPIGPGRIIDAARAVLAVGIGDRQAFRAALRAVLVANPEQFRLFDQAFHLYFRNPRLLERLLGVLLPTLEAPLPAEAQERLLRRLDEAMGGSGGKDEPSLVVDIDRAGSSSPNEILQQKDFEQMSSAELAASRRILRRGLGFLESVPTRRFVPSVSGPFYDLRRTLRLAARNGGQPALLARRKRRRRTPALVLICDISGSMSRYSRMFLLFAHAVSAPGRRVHSFVFGTRLTHISRWLRDRDVDRALEQVSARVADWDGGTRIGDCLKAFNVEWGRRVLSGDARVVLLTDGLERDSADDLGFQMDRLHRSAGQLLWLNPMLRYEKFEPRARGIRAMLPHVDRFLPAHNLDSLLSLAELLAAPARRAA